MLCGVLAEVRVCQFRRGQLLNVGLMAPSTAWLAVGEKLGARNLPSTPTAEGGTVSPRGLDVHIPELPFTTDELVRRQRAMQMQYVVCLPLYQLVPAILCSPETWHCRRQALCGNKQC